MYSMVRPKTGKGGGAEASNKTTSGSRKAPIDNACGSNLTCENLIQRRNLWYRIWSLARHLLGPSHTTLPMVQAHRVSPADHLQLPIASRPPDLTSASVGVGILRAVAEMKRISALCSSWRVGEGREAQSDFGSGPSGAGQAGPMPDKRRQRSEPSAAAVRPS